MHIRSTYISVVVMDMVYIYNINQPINMFTGTLLHSQKMSSLIHVKSIMHALQVQYHSRTLQVLRNR